MANEYVLESISPKVFKDFKSLDAHINASIVNMQKLIKTGENIKLPSQLKGFSGNAQKSIDNLNVSKKKAIGINNKLVKSQQNLIDAQSKEGKKLVEIREKTKAVNAVNRQAAREQLGITKAYAKLNIAREKARKKLQNLLAAEKQNTAAIKRADKAYQRLNARVQKVDKNTDTFYKNIGNYKSAFGGLRGGIMSIVSALGLMGGAFLFVGAIRKSIGVIREYEKANATLSAVLQLEKEDTAALRAESQRLGATTVKTANEVTQLQIAYARLGFSQQEIIDLTAATIEGSIAMNSELAETAELAGAMVNTFDQFTATDAPRIMDIMALATAKSALNFSKLQTGLPIVSGAANAAGVPFTKLVALMGKLADSGIDVSTSSTALRNIFIESAAQGLNYEQILDKIKNSTDKLTASNDEFGKRTAVSATVLAANIDKVNELDEALQGAAGTAKEMADKELATLDGALQLLKSAWEGVALKAGEAGGITEKLTGIVRYLADNLEEIASTIYTVIKGFLIYKGILIAINLIKRAAAAYAIAYRIALVAMNRGLMSSIKSLKLFRVALINTGIGAAVVVVGALVYAFIKLNKSIAETAVEMHEANEEFISGAESTMHLNKALGKAADRYDELTAKTELSKKEQTELDNIIKQIAKDVPKAVTQVDLYGNALAVNTDKIREFNEENSKLLEKEAELRIKNQAKALKELEVQQNSFNAVFETGSAIYVKGFGTIKQVGAELFKLETIISKTGNARIVETKLTLEQEVAYRKAQKAIRDSIQATQEDIEKMKI